MEDSLKITTLIKKGKVSKLSLFDMEMKAGLSIAAVPVHASLTEDLVGLNSDQGSMVMGISEYLKERAVNLSF
jgi:hypothetical protein